MKKHEARDFIMKELDSINPPNWGKYRRLLWLTGFLVGMLADAMKNDWILKNQFRNRIDLAREKYME